MAESDDLEVKLEALQEELKLLRETVFPMLADIRGRLLAQRNGA
jgi:hypothetical protein